MPDIRLSVMWSRRVSEVGFKLIKALQLVVLTTKQTEMVKRKKVRLEKRNI